MTGRDIRDTVGLIAVVAGLVFVGIEIRQNTAAVRGAAYQELTATTMAGAFGIANDGELAEILQRWLEDPDSLSPVEQMRFDNMFLGSVRNVENAFQQQRVGTLDGDLWRGYAESLRGFMGSPGFPSVWERMQSRFSTEFQTFVDTALVGIPTAPSDR